MHTPAKGDPILCYCLCSWHASPTCIVSVSYPYVYCTTCHVLAHIDLVGVHILLPGSESAHEVPV